MEMDQTLEAAVIARWTAKNGENATIRTARMHGDLASEESRQKQHFLALDESHPIGF
jgi:hypothetical protein